MSPDSAFFFSGRFIVRVTTWPSRSTVQCFVVSSSRTGMVASRGPLAMQSENVFYYRADQLVVPRGTDVGILEVRAGRP